MTDTPAGGFGLYVHWPFCQAKCPYCDFNSHVAARIDQDVWLEAFRSEIERMAEETPGRILTSVFFGGGTPSLMAPQTVANILEAVRQRWQIANDLEVTLEANPTSVEAGRFAGYRDAGVNRVSIGVQALNDADLARLGRLHTVVEAHKALEVAKSCFDRVSFDLIYARQDQTLSAWESELLEALRLAADHLSLYQLTVEPGTAFGTRHANGKLRGLPDEDLGADLYELTQNLCEAAGMPAYEISNHARDWGQSRHNLIYWRGGDYAGIGPGAHGRLTLNGRRLATETHLAPEAWLNAVATVGSGESSRVAISPVEQAEEYLMMSLRLTEGADMEWFETLAGRPLPSERLTVLSDEGLIGIKHGKLSATKTGRPVLNGLLRDLLA